MSTAAKEDIEWWIHEVSKWNGRSLQATLPELEIETDASLTGWGAYCQGNLTGGRWSEEEQSLHINELELLAAQFALRAVLKNVRDVSVLLKSDNVTTVAYINHLGGTRSRVLVNISKELWLWCLQRGIALKAQHLPGKENLKADFVSRHLRDRTDWILNPALFNLINQMWGPLQVDLFATRFSRQLPRYFSWRPDPEAEATDAFHQDWRNLKAYGHLSVVPHCSSSGKGSLPESDIGPGNSMLIDTAMVFLAYGNAGGFSPRSPRPSPVPGGHAFPQLQLPSTNNPTSVGHMEGLTGQLRAEAISEGAINLILASWREKTNATYNSAWRKWERWCAAHTTDPFSASIANVLEFLTEEFKAGREYRSLNCYRSAISSTNLPIQGFAVGKHPLVCRLLKGTYNLRPPQPKYSSLWEVGKVLAYLHYSGDNAGLSLKKLTMKLVMLLALVLAHRSSDLVRLSVVGVNVLPQAVSIPLTGLAKQSRPGHADQSSVIIASFEADPYLCPVACFKEYVAQTVTLRVHNSLQLFIVMAKTHKPVLSCTIARWIKES